MTGGRCVTSLWLALGLIGACLLCGAGCSESSPEPDGADLGGTSDVGQPRDVSAPADRQLPPTDQGPRPLDGQLPPSDLGPGPADAAPDGPASDSGTGCRSDDDCPGCQLCDVERAVCLPCECRLDTECPAGEICVEAACLPDCFATGCSGDQECDPELRRCVPRGGCARSTDCPADTACVQGSCVAADPYDTCRAPLELVPGEALEGSTRRVRDDYAGACSQGASPDAVLHFSLPEPAGVRLRVDGAGDRFDPALYLRAGGCEAGEELACLDTPFLLREVLELAELQAGDHYLFVESFGATAVGSFTVLLETFPGGLCVDDALEDNDVELGAVALELVTAAPLVACPGDADWFSVPLFEGDELLLAVTVELAMDPAVQQAQQQALEGMLLEVRDQAGQALPGGPSVEPGRVALRVGPVAEEGTYRVLVRGLPADDPLALRLPYRLGYEVLTEHGTTDCTNPTSLRAGQVVHDDTARALNHLSGTCCSELQHDAPEVVYKLRLDEESSVDVRVEADWLYALYLRRDCASPAAEDEVLCRAPGRIFLPVLEAGTYFVVLDGFAGAAGPYAISADVGPARHPPDHDLCAGAVELLPGVPVHGSTRFATNGSRGSCTAAIGHTGPDVIYRFVLEEAAPVRIVLEPEPVEGELWVPALYLQQQCGDTMSEEACEHLEPRLELELPAGEHFLVVDAWKSDGGPYTLTLDSP